MISVGRKKETLWHGLIRLYKKTMELKVSKTDLRPGKEMSSRYTPHLEVVGENRVDELSIIKEQLQQEIAKREKTEEILKSRTLELIERHKELNYLYGISHLTEKLDLSLEQLLQGMVNLIPQAWQYPEITCAGIILKDQTFRTDNFRETAWRQTSGIVVHGEAVGSLEVYYLEEKPKSDEGPFLKEERNLINVIAEGAGRIIERKAAEEDRQRLLDQIEIERARLEAVFQQMPEGVVIARAPSGEIIFANEQVQKIWQAFSFIDIKNYQEYKCFRPDGQHYQPEEWPLARSIRKGEVIIDEEIHCLRGDGSKGIMKVRSSPIYNKGGQITCSVGIFYDTTERKQIDEMYSRLAAIVEFTEDAIISKTLDGIITSWNQGAERMYGYSAEEAVGRSISLIFPPELLDELPEILTKLKSGEIIGHSETVRVRKDGKQIDVYLTISPLKDKTGKIVGTSTIERDISEQKRMEEELKHYHRHLEDLVTARTKELIDSQNQMAEAQRLAHLGSYEWDIATDKVSWSGELYNILGVESSVQNLSLDWGIAQLVYPDDQNYLKGLFEKAVRDKEPFEYKHRVVRPDGSIRFLQGRAEVITDAAGNSLKVIGFVQDITEIKQVENALRETGDYLEKLIRYANAPIIVWNPDMAITRFNRAFEYLTGYAADEIIGQKLSILFPDSSRDQSLHKITRALSGEYWQWVEIPILCKDGGIRLVLWNSANIYTEDNTTLIATIAQGVDITERKRAEEEKEKIQAQLLQSQKMEAIGILAGGVAHDFNNLLTTILGYTALAMMHIPDSDPAFRDLHQIRQSAGRAANLTRQLLLFSRKQLMESTSIDLNNLVNNLLNMLYRLIGEDITITTDLESHLWPIMADEGTIEQVIMNLAVNARDAMTKGGRLTIKTENVVLDEDDAKTISDAQAGKFVRFSITDTGGGMDAKTIERIFEPFFTTKGLGKGTGLGLSVVYGIVKQHEGWINVYSEPGQGSVFKIYLPAYLRKEKKEEGEEIPFRNFHGKGERILMVEDEENVRKMTVRILRENGYHIIEASHGQEALKIFEQEEGKFDLVLSDVVLPDRTGIELVDQILSLQPEIHVLLMSGYTDQKSQWPIIKERGFRFLQKPYDITGLLQTLREIIETKGG